MANRFHEDEFDMSGSIFDVFDCGNEESAVSSVWVKVEPAASVDYDDGIDDIINFIGQAPDLGAFEFGEPSEIMAGDTNFDGIVDILDIVRIVNQIIGNSEFNSDEFTAADYNSDSIVDILDIVQSYKLYIV